MSNPSASTIKVLTLNCWGLKWLSADRELRIRAIADAISQGAARGAGSGREGGWDVVALQEIWVHSDFELVRARVGNEFRFAKMFFSGALGSGLAIFSRFPIVESYSRSYPLNGSPLAVAAGDWFVGKAAASVTLAHPVLGEVEVFTTHMYASGGEDGPEVRRAHRLVQAWVLANLVRASAGRGRHVIVTGDLNSIPTALSIALLSSHALLTDAFGSTHSTPLPGTGPNTSYSLQSAELAIRDLGVTADSPLNSYSADKKLDATARRWQGKRLDYIFYRSERMVCVDSGVVFTGKVPGHDISYSDHFGLEATFTVDPAADVARPPPPKPLIGRTLSLTLQALTASYRLSRRTASSHLLTFSLCLAALLALIVGSAFLPDRRVEPLFVILAAAATWGGTTMLYVGVVYGRWEVRVLMGVIEEMELEMRRVEGSVGGGVGSEPSSEENVP